MVRGHLTALDFRFKSLFFKFGFIAVCFNRRQQKRIQEKMTFLKVPFPLFSICIFSILNSQLFQ